MKFRGVSLFSINGGVESGSLDPEEARRLVGLVMRGRNLGNERIILPRLLDDDERIGLMTHLKLHHGKLSRRIRLEIDDPLSDQAKTVVLVRSKGR